MESPTRPILSPSKVLHPVSPERMNQQNTIPASPSLPSDLLNLHHKNTKGVSEVQAKVAFLNSLSRGGSPVAPSQSAANTAALQRAILGREEAESALVSVQDDLAEAQTRERRISERLESLLEELHNAKERQAHERSIFEKEIRKARKEAFRAGSTLVKLQEELKHSKSEAKALKDEVATERESKDKAKQEAFERAYALAGLTEEVEVLKGKLRSMEASNHSTSLEVRAHEIRKEDFGRLSIAEGDLAFLTTPRRPKRAAVGSVKSPAPEIESEESAEATPPKRPRLSECTTTAEETDISTTTISPPDSNNEMIEELKEELAYEQRRRVEAEEMVHFLNIECQFERCSCRLAESEGRRYIYDADYFEKFQRPQLEAEAEAKREAAQKARAHHQLENSHLQSSHTPEVDPPTSLNYHHQTEPVIKPEPTDPPEQTPMPEEPLVTFSPETGTFKTFPSPLRDNARARRTDSLASPELPYPNTSTDQDWKNSTASSNFHVKSFTPCEERSSSRLARATGLTEQAIDKTYNPPEAADEARPAKSVVKDHHHQPTYPATKRVPLREAAEPQSSSSGFVSDAPINREEALAQIRARRSRARSKQRSVSENEASRHSAGSTSTTPGRGPRRVPNLQTGAKSESDLSERRDLSAPVRMFRR